MSVFCHLNTSYFLFIWIIVNLSSCFMSLFWIAIKNLRVLIDQYSFYMSLFKDVNYLMNFYILIPSNIMHLNFYIHSIRNNHISRIVISNAKSPVVVFLTPKYISFIYILHSFYIYFLYYCVYTLYCWHSTSIQNIPYVITKTSLVPVSKTYNDVGNTWHLSYVPTKTSLLRILPLIWPQLYLYHILNIKKNER